MAVVAVLGLIRPVWEFVGQPLSIDALDAASAPWLIGEGMTTVAEAAHLNRVIPNISQPIPSRALVRNEKVIRLLTVAAGGAVRIVAIIARQAISLFDRATRGHDRMSGADGATAGTAVEVRDPS